MQRLESVCAADTEPYNGSIVLCTVHTPLYVRLVANVPGYKIGLHPTESPRITCQR